LEKQMNNGTPIHSAIDVASASFSPCSTQTRPRTNSGTISSLMRQSTDHRGAATKAHPEVQSDAGQ
jgi:hypothetical protein